jgi:polyribonucleotide nucleotidyltransferase
MHIKNLDFHGRKISIETGKIARLASGSVTITCGETVVLVTCCVGEKRGGDFLPLTMDYIEKTYAAGKIPGGFFKREGKLSERETLISRILDRPCRPLFPEGFANEVQVIATVLSVDTDFDPDVLAVLGSSSALVLSEAPFQGPVAAVRVVRIQGELKINPSYSDLESADLNYVVAGTKDAIVMVEGGSSEVPEQEVLEALFYAHEQMQPLIVAQEEMQKEFGKEKMLVEAPQVPQVLIDKASQILNAEKLKTCLSVKEKSARRKEIGALKGEFFDACLAVASDNDKDVIAKSLETFFDNALSDAVRKRVFEEDLRIDGRDTKTVRPISTEVGLLPRAHGSALFTRGETQAVVVATLGTEQEAQRLDGLVGESTKSFMLHYNFPPFSVGETKPLRGPGRREIGHGALAERAIRMMMPPTSQFPYVVRVVSEITESNGSSSMATVCGASMALMEAGVPLKAPVAGVAMGLLKEGEKFAILTDILGDEDHLGDMDFKVAGTEKGVTALQMDIKISGLTREIMVAALNQAKQGRLHILSEMKKTITEHRKKLSKYAPKIVTMKINPDKIRDVIGSGGKVIRSITESCGVKIEIDDSGTVSISSYDEESIAKALKVIEGIVEEVEIGKLYEGVVKRIVDFGAFVEVIPGVDGLVHISQLADRRVNRVEEVVNEGDIIWVKVLDIDRQGKIRLSHKEALVERQQTA